MGTHAMSYELSGWVGWGLGFRVWCGILSVKTLVGVRVWGLELELDMCHIRSRADLAMQ